jgi:hypothetical protein
MKAIPSSEPRFFPAVSSLSGEPQTQKRIVLLEENAYIYIAQRESTDKSTSSLFSEKRSQDKNEPPLLLSEEK